MVPLNLRKSSSTSNQALYPAPVPSIQAEERKFLLALEQSISDGIRDSMGPQILGMLRDKGFLDHPTNPDQFHKQLTTLFGNGAVVLEKIVVKELYRKLNLPYDSSAQLDYGNALAWARQVSTIGGL